MVTNGRSGGLNVHDHLLAGEQAIGDEFASANGDLGVSHVCGREWW